MKCFRCCAHLRRSDVHHRVQHAQHCQYVSLVILKGADLAARRKKSTLLASD